MNIHEEYQVDDTSMFPYAREELMLDAWLGVGMKVSRWNYWVSRMRHEAAIGSKATPA